MTRARGWFGPIAPLGVPTGDRRIFPVTGLTKRPLPLPVMYQQMRQAKHEGAYRVGSILSIARHGGPHGVDSGTYCDFPGPHMCATGSWLSNKMPMVKEAKAIMAAKQGFPSVDIDNYTVSMKGDSAEPVAHYNNARIAGITMVPIPAFPGIRLQRIPDARTLYAPLPHDVPAASPERKVDPMSTPSTDPGPNRPLRAGAKPAQNFSDGSGNGQKVYDQLIDAYPDSALRWVLDTEWTKRTVPLSQLDFSTRASWKASGEPDKVARFVDKVKQGDVKPIVAVEVPGRKGLVIADGHHRTLAYEKLGKPVLAWVAKVPNADGPWMNMHRVQRREHLELDTFSVNGDGWRGLPIAPRNSAFDADEAHVRIYTWAGGSETTPADPAKLNKMYLYRDPQGQAGDYTSYRLPIGDIIDGKPTVVYHAIYAAAALVNGAHGGLPNVPEADKDKLRSIITQIYRAMSTSFGDNGMVAPWDRSGGQKEGMSMDSETFGVRTSWSLPIAPPGTSWDGAGAPARIAKWAGGPGDGTNWAKYAQAFLWAGKTGPGASQGDFKLPIADVINGKLMIVPKAIAAVKGALSGARGGVDIPPTDKSTIAGVIGRLSKRWDPDGDGDDDRSPATDSDKDQGKKGGASIHPDAMAVKVPKGIKGAPGPMKEVPDADGTASIHKGAEGKHHPGPMSIHKDAEGKHHPGPMSKKDDKGDKVEPEVEPDEPDDDEDDDEDENQPQPPEEKPGQGKATKKDLKKAQKTAKKAQKSAGGVAGEPDSDTYSLVAGGPLAPPLEWFANPKLERLTNLAVTAEGRVYGHLAPWGQAHISFSDAQMVAPHSATEYAYFLTGEVLCNDGTTVPVGRITIGTGHADPNFGFRPALAHYDNTGTCAAVVNVGEDEYGIWVAGVTVPNLTDEQTAELRRSPLSGDWRRIHGNLELIGALAVNHPGFPVARVEGSRQLSLVAAGMAVPDLAGTPMTVGIGPDLTVDDIVELAVREASIRGERQAQLATLMAVDAMRRAQALAELPASIGE